MSTPIFAYFRLVSSSNNLRRRLASYPREIRLASEAQPTPAKKKVKKLNVGSQ
jgi:hypothetical protein